MSEAAASPAALGGIAALDVRGNFLFDPASHPDYLGAILGTGETTLEPSWGQVGLHRSHPGDRFALSRRVNGSVAPTGLCV